MIIVQVLTWSTLNLKINLGDFRHQVVIFRASNLLEREVNGVVELTGSSLSSPSSSSSSLFIGEVFSIYSFSFLFVVWYFGRVWQANPNSNNNLMIRQAGLSILVQRRLWIMVHHLSAFVNLNDVWYWDIDNVYFYLHPANERTNYSA